MTHVSFPIGSGQTLNLPVNQEFDFPEQLDDEAVKQLEDFTEALKSSILQMKLAKEKWLNVQITILNSVSSIYKFVMNHVIDKPNMYLWFWLKLHISNKWK